MVKSTVLVFLKHPAAGTAKSRIAATHGPRKAAAIYDELLTCTAQAVADHAHQVVYTGEGPLSALQALFPLASGFTPQCEGHLGQRIAQAVSRFPADHPLCIIGADCPTLTGQDIHAAFAALAHSDLAIGPALDGGYWLIALRPACAGIFHLTSWSTDHLFKDTLALSQNNGWRVSVLQPLADIDTHEDYLAWKGR